ncbi:MULTISPECIES: hypothetical protein [unclassified Leifsonia]|uniref:hypothetical protein n=1 Tax=unclassified Leifsonia TaxID=2663824 RepID=UPI000ABC9606|nr:MULTISPECIES: hypothetical protein [unclassified Leifsonia]
MATAVVVGIIVVWTVVAFAAAIVVGAVIRRADRERRIVVEPDGSTLVGAGVDPRVR